MLLRLAQDMLARGHDVHIISWDRPEAKTFYPLPDDVHWHRLGFAKGGARTVTDYSGSTSPRGWI